jgi:hypothetical protein
MVNSFNNIDGADWVGTIFKKLKYSGNKMDQLNGKIFIMEIKALIFAIALFLPGCASNTQKIKLDLINMENEVKANYQNKELLFDEIKSCFKFKQIKAIEFKEKDDVLIEYTLMNQVDWMKVDNGIFSDQVREILSADGLSVDDLLKLRLKLAEMNINRIVLSHDYEATKGFEFERLKLRYSKEVNDQHFFYIIFGRQLDSIESFHYSWVNQNNIGGILGPDIVYYHD